MASKGYYSVGDMSMTESEWLATDPVLQKGEVAYVSDKRLTKHGDGINKFSVVQYDSGSGESIEPSTTLAGYGITDAYTKLEVEEILNEKADKYTENGGFVAGQNATVSEGGSHIAIGKGAKANFASGDAYENDESGVAIGKNAESNDGGVAIGAGASGTYGGVAIGAGASGTYGGVAIGAGASGTYGGAVGNNASASYGGAVGHNAETSSGFAGGYDARTIANEKTIDAIQLGTGTNPNEYTMQIYDYQLLTDDASPKSVSDGSKYLKDVGKLSNLNTTDKTDIVSAINELDTNKVDKYTENGGFAAGNGAKTGYGVAIGKNAINEFIDNESDEHEDGISIGTGATSANKGISIGNNANATTDINTGIAIGNNSKAGQCGTAIGNVAEASNEDIGGVSIGYAAISKHTGISIGMNAYTSETGIGIGISAVGNDDGVSIGANTKSEYNAVAIGTNAKATKGGVALGLNAESEYGFAGGSGAVAGGGFSGGNNAKVSKDSNKDYIDAIQLGEGTNSNEYTAQIYDYQLLADDAKSKSVSDGSKYLKDVGKLSNLNTTDKSDIVSAINSIKTNTTTISNSNGGFAAGTDASTQYGVSIGKNTKSTVGVSIGDSSNSSGNGISIGEEAESYDGGISFGRRTYSKNNIQLGTGTNENEYTAQIYDYQLLADDAKSKSVSDGSKYLKDVGKLSKLNTTDKTDIVSAINELDTNKVDKYTENGGFVAGKDAYVESNAAGVVIGNKANISSDNAIAIGNNAHTYGGIVIGKNASCEYGVAIGSGASSHVPGGIAIGDGAVATNNDNPLECIQLGEGTNSNEYTMQVYDYQLLADDAKSKSVTDGSKYLKDVGKLSNLNTTNKENIVSAINSILSVIMTPEMHRTTFRGKNLGDSVTDAQKTAITNGTFDDLFLGDYWLVDDVKWRIVDFDYWNITNHHLVIMSDSVLYNSSISGYYGNTDTDSTTILDQAHTKLTGKFDDILVTHPEIFASSYTNGKISEIVKTNCNMEIPSEIMIYGKYVFSQGYDNANNIQSSDCSYRQLSLFNICPKYIYADSAYWLRDIVGSSNRSIVSTDGPYWDMETPSENGIRPVFAIG